MSTDLNKNPKKLKNLNKTDTFCSVDLMALGQTATHWIKENNTNATGFFTHSLGPTTPSLKDGKNNTN